MFPYIRDINKCDKKHSYGVCSCVHCVCVCEDLLAFMIFTIKQMMIIMMLFVYYTDNDDNDAEADDVFKCHCNLS